MHTAIVLSANGAYQHVNGVDTDQRELHLLGTSHGKRPANPP